MVENRRDSETGSLPDDNSVPNTLATACFGDDALNTKKFLDDNYT